MRGSQILVRIETDFQMRIDSKHYKPQYST